MMLARKYLLSGLAVLAISASVAAREAKAQFAMTTIENTAGAPVIYQHRWGESGPMQSIVLQPGMTYTHYVTNNGYVPWLNVEFDTIGGDGFYTPIRYRLSSYLGSNTSQAKRYQFRLVGFNTINLFAVN